MAAKGNAGLDIDEDMRFHERNWLLQRIGWIGITLVLGAALAGVFGSGWLSKGSISAPGGALYVEYDRFARYIAPTALRIRLTPKLGQRQVGLGVSTDFLDTVQLERITPEPESVEARADQLVYFFKVADAGRPSTVVFHLKTQHLGRVSGRVALVDGPAVTFEQFVYP